MIKFVLIMFFHVGPMGSGDSNATSVVHGFELKSECEAAGNAAVSMTRGTVKEASFVCVQQTVGGQQ